ncbi:MAG: hypothetical protein NVS9B10_23610 [Nevskia sp.]
MNRILFPLVSALLPFAGLSPVSIASARTDASPAAGYCAKNPQACSDATERVRKRCADDPAACERKQARLHDKRAELKVRCEADPAACEQKKQEFRERLRQRHRDRVSPAGETPPIIQPKPSS